MYMFKIYIGMDVWERLASATGFEWDKGNTLKNWEKHQVSPFECEQLFFNRPLIVHISEVRIEEERYYCLGKADSGKLLFLVFTMRAERIRVISARPMSRGERKVYESHE